MKTLTTLLLAGLLGVGSATEFTASWDPYPVAGCTFRVEKLTPTGPKILVSTTEQFIKIEAEYGDSITVKAILPNGLESPTSEPVITPIPAPTGVRVIRFHAEARLKLSGTIQIADNSEPPRER